MSSGSPKTHNEAPGMPRIVWHSILLLTLFQMVLRVSAEPVLDLVCLRDREEFSIKVTKNGASYVEVYAKGHEKEVGCRLVDESSLDHFYFNVSIERCGVVENTTDGSHHLTVYVAGQAVFLTSKDSVYDAGCNFNKYTYKVSSVNDPNAGEGGPGDSTRFGSDDSESKDNRTTMSDSMLRRANLWEGERLDELSLEIYSVERSTQTNTANVGEEIQLMIILDPSDPILKNIEYTAECYMYSNETKLPSTRYQLTANDGCPVPENELFSTGLEAVPQELIPDLEGVMTPPFPAPYYPSTGLLYFECFVELCGDDNCEASEPPVCPAREQRSYIYDENYYYGADHDSYDSTYDSESEDYYYYEPEVRPHKSRRISSVVYVRDGSSQPANSNPSWTRSGPGAGSGEYESCSGHNRRLSTALYVSSFLVILMAALAITIFTRQYLKRAERTRQYRTQQS